MLTNINWLLVLGVSVINIIIGSIWYGPMMFGKFWMRLMGAEKMTEAQKKKAQKDMIPMYVIQFLMSFIINIFLYIAIKINSNAMMSIDLVAAFTLWLGFMMPIQAGDVIWSNLTHTDKLKKFAVSASSQLISVLVAAAIFSAF